MVSKSTYVQETALSTARHACRAYFGNGHSEDTSAITQDEHSPSLGAAAKASHLACCAMLPLSLQCMICPFCPALLKTQLPSTEFGGKVSHVRYPGQGLLRNQEQDLGEVSL